MVWQNLDRITYEQNAHIRSTKWQIQEIQPDVNKKFYKCL